MSDRTLDADGRTIPFSSADRQLWPLTGTTKADLAAYYTRVAPVLLPHLTGRPVTLRRFPSGVDGPGFYQSRCPPHPDWVRTTTLRLPRTGKTFEAAVLDDAASLLWAANLARLGLHPFLHLAHGPERPTAIVFDLDPGPPAGLREAARVALAARDILVDDGLHGWPKSSGVIGLHVYVPLNCEHATYVATKRYARDVATGLARCRADVVRTCRGRCASARCSSTGARTTRASPRPRRTRPARWERRRSPCRCAGTRSRRSSTAATRAGSLRHRRAARASRAPRRPLRARADAPAEAAGIMTPGG